jgi:hypothetical protein
VNAAQRLGVLDA